MLRRGVLLVLGVLLLSLTFPSPAWGDEMEPLRERALRIVENLRAVGVPEAQIPFYVSIAMAESRGRTDWDGDVEAGRRSSKWGSSIGPFQIRSLDADFGTGSFRDEQALRDPLFNAAAAKFIMEEDGGRQRWTTVQNNDYTDWLELARIVAGVGRAR